MLCVSSRIRAATVSVLQRQKGAPKLTAKPIICYGTETYERKTRLEAEAQSRQMNLLNRQIEKWCDRRR